MKHNGSNKNQMHSVAGCATVFCWLFFSSSTVQHLAHTKQTTECVCVCVISVHMKTKKQKNKKQNEQEWNIKRTHARKKGDAHDTKVGARTCYVRLIVDTKN